MAIVYNTSAVKDGLVFCFDAANPKSYSGSGTSCTDVSPSKSSGALTNGPIFTTNNRGGLIFDAVDDFVDFGNVASLNFGTGDFTVEAWALRYANATTNLRILSKGAGSDVASEAGFAFFGSNTAIDFIVNPSGTRISAGASIAVNTPFCVTGVVTRGDTQRIYKNGVLGQSVAVPVGSVTGTASFLIGCNGTSAGSRNLSFSGEIYAVKIYNRALSQTEITQNFEAQRGRFGI